MGLPLDVSALSPNIFIGRKIFTEEQGLYSLSWGTLFTSELCLGGHFQGGTLFTMTLVVFVFHV